MPAASTLAEIGSQYVGLNLFERDEVALGDLANGVLTGRVTFAGQSPVALPFPFRASHLDVGLPTQQLAIAGMATSYTLLQAYHATQDKRFLDGALEETLAFADIDYWRMLPRGFIWNDHALAIRMAVIVDLWLQVRTRPDLDARRARYLLRLADKTAARLAKPELFTFKTNHGVMQSLALLQFAAAFPTLERATESRTIGCARLVEQVQYYIGAEGITLEHSAGYHELGRRLLSLAVRLLEMNTCPLPSDWPGKVSRAAEFSHLLTRPDRSLPSIGNTDHGPISAEDSIDISRPPQRDLALFPTAGFFVSWRGLTNWPNPSLLTHTVATWSNFPSRAHKHADEMSVIIWAAGRPWLTNTGYWPYAEGYDSANGWRGSNAPHARGESVSSERTTTLLGVVESPQVRLLDMERRVVGKAVSFRRQIVEIGGPTWIVVDSSDGPVENGVDIIWTSMPETGLKRVGETEYLMTATDVPADARISFLGEPVVAVQVRRGETDPFAGWIVRSSRPTPAPSFEVSRRSPGTALTVLSIGSASQTVPALGPGPINAENWQVTLRDSASKRSVRRIGNRVLFSDSGSENEDVEIGPPPATAGERRTIIEAFEKAARSYPGVRDLTEYRWKLSWLMLGLLFAEEVTIFAVLQWNRAAACTMRAVATPAWIALGLYAYYVYLR